MRRHWDRAYWATLLLMSIFALGFAVAFAISAAAETAAGQRAARKAAIESDRESGYRSPTFLVDGTPRPSEADPQPLRAPKNVGRASGRINLVPDNPDNRPMRSLSTVIGEAGMEMPLGGDDVLISSAASLNFAPPARLQIASDGTAFIAVQNLGTVDVYRSTDGGETWTLWSTFSDPTFLVIGDFVVAEGDADRALIAYQTNHGDSEIRIAYADIAGGVPTWTVVTALAASGRDFREVDMDTDAAGPFPSFFVYVVAWSTDGSEQDVWFARSTTEGNSYSAGYSITDAEPSNVGFFGQSVSYGSGNWVHAGYNTSSPTEVNIKHRRAPSFAGLGSPSWEVAQTVKAQTPGFIPEIWSMGASKSDGTVLISLGHDIGVNSTVRYSTDFGASWPVANETLTGLQWFANTDPIFQPSGAVILGGPGFDGPPQSERIDFVRSTTLTLGTWSPLESIARYERGSASGRLRGIASDPTRGDRVAVAWIHLDAADDPHLRFDAEWRRDVGYANTEVGFPVNPTNFGQTPPAIAELDGDPFGEIVFGTITGDIFVYDHLGQIVPGWPVNIGSIPIDAPVAIGKLTTGPPAIVAGNLGGQVYAFDPNGNLLPGWPVQLADTAATYVSIGALGPPEGRYVVAVSGCRMHVLRHDGVDVAPFWKFTENFSRPAAIGDINNDGIAEIVTLKGEWFHVHQLGQNGNLAFRRFFGEPTSDAATLADVDGDGDLEIAVPTTTGKMYLLNHDGTDYPGWPVTVPSGSALTAASFADYLGTTDVEMVFAERSGTGLVHLFFAGTGPGNATEQGSYPHSFGSNFLFMPPILDAITPTGAAALAVAGVDVAYSWDGVNFVPPGWPRNLPGTVEETFASGDIDNDGRNEIVILGVNFLTVMDVGKPPNADGRRRWPMYGYDAQRTGCLDCAEIATGIGDTPPDVSSGEVGVDVYPNPFNPVTTISYNVAKAGPVTLEVFDIAGRRIDTLISGEFHTADRYTLNYEPHVATGVYLLRLEAGGEVVTRKINLLK